MRNLWSHWHVGHNQRSHPPETPVQCFTDPADAVRALGEAIDEWADNELQLPDDERDPEVDFAAALAEIFTGGRSAEFGDEVARVRRGGTGYQFGECVYWAVPAPDALAPAAAPDAGCVADD